VREKKIAGGDWGWEVIERINSTVFSSIKKVSLPHVAPVVWV
jgi:hypothetical protein